MACNAPITIATDGSVGKSMHRGRRSAAAAWVCDDGRCGYTRSTSRNINVVELIAIADALTNTRSGARVTVLSDSKTALRIIRTGAMPSEAYARPLARIQHSMTRMHVEFEWTPAHRGPGLNAIADGIAVLVRRFGTSIRTRTEVHDFVRDSLAAAAA